MIPTRACICHLGDGRTLHAAIYAAGSPDLDAQVVDFATHHSGPGHQRVERLPKEPGRRDIPWGRNGV